MRTLTYRHGYSVATLSLGLLTGNSFTRCLATARGICLMLRGFSVSAHFPRGMGNEPGSAVVYLREFPALSLAFCYLSIIRLRASVELGNI